MAVAAVMAISEPSNGAAAVFSASIPYLVFVTIRGTADLLLHAWNVEAVEAKGKSKKGSETKKTDNLESYVRRADSGNICLPGEYLRGAIINAAKYRQDPRSPRKSAMDLYKAGIVSYSPLAIITAVSGDIPKIWDYEHRCRVQVQRAGITRCRPAFRAGWTAEVALQCNLPEYISPDDLNDVIGAAGRLVGVGDFRPTYGRFAVTNFQVREG